jgi:hypothetical protein
MKGGSKMSPLKKMLIGIYALCGLLPQMIFAQEVQDSREYIRNSIKEWGLCHNVAITKTNGDIALTGKNTVAYANIPSSLVDAIQELRNSGENIKDIQLTESGRWLILYGNNGCWWDGLSDDDTLLQELQWYNQRGEVITSVTFNDYGDWVVTTENNFSCSDTGIQTWLEEGIEKYGSIWAVSIGDDDCVVAVFKDGYRFLGDIPEDLKKELRNTDLDVFRLKVAGDSWFFADVNGHYKYNM